MACAQLDLSNPAEMDVLPSLIVGSKSIASFVLLLNSCNVASAETASNPLHLPKSSAILSASSYVGALLFSKA